MQLSLYIENHLDKAIEPQFEAMWQLAANTAFAEVEALADKSIELNLLLCDDEEIREYNSEYREIDRATDVLSFPLIEDWEELGQQENDIPVIMGDIIISMPRAQAQAEEYGHSLQREAVFLFIHGVLHCLGYDHIEESDELIMREKQRQLLSALKLEINND